jgi:3-oxoacyl-[acyl-carrier-protein] synthase II
LNVASTWEGLLAGRSGAGPITRFDPDGYETKIACEVKDFEAGNYLDRKEARRMDRFTHLGIAASREALSDAGLATDDGVAEEIGVIVGTGVGGIETLCQQHRILMEKGPSRVSPFLTTMMAANMASGHISICLGMRGPTYGLVSACASGAHALGEACETIRRGRVPVMLAGGAEAPVVPLALGTFNSMRALSVRNDEPTKASRPFDAERDGFVLAEGSGMLVLEDAEHALARGARIYAEIAGYGATSDAFHVTVPAEGGAGAAKAMTVALTEAGVDASDVDYINAHGTSTTLNDRAETQAIKEVFGDRAYAIPISSTKSMTGHLLGAAGAVEAIVCLLAMRDGFVPPTINQEHPDPDCDLDFVPNVSRRASVRVSLSNSLGFGGHNATLVFRAWES